MSLRATVVSTTLDRVKQRMLAGAIACVFLSACTGGRDEGSMSVGPSAAPLLNPTASIAALHRPLQVPRIATGEPCPVTLRRHLPDPALGPIQGDGPAGATGIEPDGTLRYVAPMSSDAVTDKSWGVAKALWEVDSTVSGSVLVRGRQLDGPHEVRFNDPAADELVLEPKPPITPGGWRDYPSYTRLRSPGCYAYQVDTPSGTALIVFRALGPTVRQ